MKLLDAIIDRLRNNGWKLREAIKERDEAREELRNYQKRFRELGARQVNTYAPAQKIITLEVKPVPYGTYGVVNDLALFDEEWLNRLKGTLVRQLAQAMIENDIVQYIIKEGNQYGGPLDSKGTVGAKLYVVPWEQLSLMKPLYVKVFEGAFPDGTIPDNFHIHKGSDHEPAAGDAGGGNTGAQCAAESAGHDNKKRDRGRNPRTGTADAGTAAWLPC